MLTKSRVFRDERAQNFTIPTKRKVSVIDALTRERPGTKW
jgi:hypothetical protein